MALARVLRSIATHPLNRGHELRAVARFAKWQLGTRLVPGAIIFDWVNGARFRVSRGETGLTGNVYMGLHEFPDMGFLLHFLRPEDLFVDVGANAGSYTLLAAAAIGARAVAFEPIPSTYGRLVDNLRLNHLEQRVTALNQGVGDLRGKLRFTADRDTVNHALAAGEEHANTLEVEVTTLDEALAEESPALMKIDVEGFETPALAGAHALLARPSLRAIILELNGSGSRYGYDDADIVRTLASHGFETFSYEPFTRRLRSLDGKNCDSGNTLFIRDESFVNQRVKSAPRITVGARQF
ncbi:MAG: FkbM family methyltransferase [Sorangiineae bacterium]|nr:FkbM family methyltransferase [Polyangiaceae bacterium]MEB2324451.1 FkbM family methyltransferase [Sorangiineae bacterium]